MQTYTSFLIAYSKTKYKGNQVVKKDVKRSFILIATDSPGFLLGQPAVNWEKKIRRKLGKKLGDPANK